VALPAFFSVLASDKFSLLHTSWAKGNAFTPRHFLTGLTEWRYTRFAIAHRQSSKNRTMSHRLLIMLTHSSRDKPRPFLLISSPIFSRRCEEKWRHLQKLWWLIEKTLFTNHWSDFTLQHFLIGKSIGRTSNLSDEIQTVPDGVTQ
jgi:hypothetical protein